MIGLIVSVAAAVAAPPACTAAAMRPAVAAAAKALAAKQLTAANTAVAPVLACPVVDGVSYTGHVLGAEIAVARQDWAAGRAALAGVGVHPESPLSARAGFLRLRADEGLGDAAAFTADRAALLAANDARLAAAGRRIETFRAGATQVQAYEAAVTQGTFHRIMEFIATPDDPAAYPIAILLGQDDAADQVAKELDAAKPGAAKPAMWFLDLYTCGTHATLATPPVGDAPPPYTDMKAKAVAALEERAQQARSVAGPNAACFGGRWLLPGLGAH